MNKKLIFSLIVLSLFSISFVSAGLCLGYDNYYHDCDDSRYYERDYDDYYSHGKYYPSRNYYYDNYYKPSYRDNRYGSRRSNRNDIEIKYDDVEEYKKTVNYEYEDRYGIQKYKTTLNQKTEISFDYDLPYYLVYDNSQYSNKGKDDY